MSPAPSPQGRTAARVNSTSPTDTSPEDVPRLPAKAGAAVDP
ncbi:hypothetical protein ACW0JT_23005 [Arthrobacter sp. SA17]